MMFDLPSGHSETLILLAVVGGLHALTFGLKIVRHTASDLREELKEWRKFFRGG